MYLAENVLILLAVSLPPFPLLTQRLWNISDFNKIVQVVNFVSANRIDAGDIRILRTVYAEAGDDFIAEFLKAFELNQDDL